MIKKLCLVLFAVLAFNVHSQEGTSSPYSFYGIGSLKFKGTVENRSMGGLSIYTDSIHMNLRNPASYGGLSLKSFNNEGRAVKYTVGATYSDTKLKSDSGNDKANTTTFDYLAMSFPIGKLGIGFGLMPYTSVGYKLQSRNDEDAVTNRYRGEGGLNKAFIGAGYQVNDELSIGVDVSYNFGNVQNTSVEFVYDENGDLLQYQSRENNRSDLSGLTLNFGATYKPMITEKLQLTTALTFSPKADLTSDNDRVFSTIATNLSTGQELVVNEINVDLAALGLNKTTVTLPSRTAFGLGIGSPRKWFLGAEYTFQKTSEYSNSLIDIDNTTFEDSSIISLGGFYIPQYTSFNKYWKRVVYRAGMRFENTGLKINDETINEFGISFGVGLPVGRWFSNANFGFEVGKRGTTKANLVQENFINFQLSLSLNDRWFEKRKFN